MIDSTNSAVNFQPENLENELVRLVLLKSTDFERIYAVASDSLIWEQHPNNDRYKRDVFENFFDEALQSKSAFAILDAKTDEAIGSSRFYDYVAEKKFVAIGYTFLARKHWGGIYNKEVKSLMLNYAFQFVDTVIFHIGAENLRSQKATEKLGAKKLDDAKSSFYGEVVKDRWVFALEKKDWQK